jgi:GT2 family glycosyltransferase
MSDITLMMVTYNRLDLTKRTLENLWKSTDVPYNLVIIDNGSTDGTVRYLLELKDSTLPNVETFVIQQNMDNKGIADGRNAALKIADEIGTKWYCTIDNDVEVPSGWLGECIDILKVNKKYGMIGVNMEGVKYPLITENGKTFQSKPQGNLGTACMVFRKQVHQALGFFKKYNKYGLEDSDFGMRARVFGFKLGYIKRMGNHIGSDEKETSDYRKFKTTEHDSKVQEFKKNCALYYNKKLPIYVKYEG